MCGLHTEPNRIFVVEVRACEQVKCAAMIAMRVRNEGAPEAKPKAKAQAIECKHSERERSLGIKATWSLFLHDEG